MNSPQVCLFLHCKNNLDKAILAANSKYEKFADVQSKKGIQHWKSWTRKSEWRLFVFGCDYNSVNNISFMTNKLYNWKIIKKPNPKSKHDCRQLKINILKIVIYCNFNKRTNWPHLNLKKKKNTTQSCFSTPIITVIIKNHK